MRNFGGDKYRFIIGVGFNAAGRGGKVYLLWGEGA